MLITAPAGASWPDAGGEVLSLVSVVRPDYQETPAPYHRVALGAELGGKRHRLAMRRQLHPDLEQRVPLGQRLARLLGVQPRSLGLDFGRRGR